MSPEDLPPCLIAPVLKSMLTARMPLSDLEVQQTTPAKTKILSFLPCSAAVPEVSFYAIYPYLLSQSQSLARQCGIPASRLIIL